VRILGAVAVLLLALAVMPARASSVAVVNIYADHFDPTRISMSTDDGIRWMNFDSVPRSICVTNDHDQMCSPPIVPNDSSQTLELDQGEYHFHFNMDNPPFEGSISVAAGSLSPGTTPTTRAARTTTTRKSATSTTTSTPVDATTTTESPTTTTSTTEPATTTSLAQVAIHEVKHQSNTPVAVAVVIGLLAIVGSAAYSIGRGRGRPSV